MPRLSVRLAVSVFLFLVIAFQIPQTAEAGVTVEDRELVSKRRVGRTTILYTYRLTIQNIGTTLSDVKVYVSCDNPGTTLIDDIVEFGDIAENDTLTSTDTFSFRQDRRQPFDPDCLIYEVGFLTTLIISGTATDTELSNAIIIGTVTHPDSGRPIIESGRPIIEEFSTTADDQGDYTLTMDAITEDDFITLEAQGVDDQDGAVLTSSVGSVGMLQEQGSSGSIVIDSGDNGATNITHITTAQDQLVKNLNNGVLPTNDGELAELQSQVNGGELLEMASLIKTIVDNANIPLPPGFNTTAELIADPVAFEAALEDVQTNFPIEFQTATEETADALEIGYTPDEVPGRLYTTIVNELPLFGNTFVFDFDGGGGGSVILSLDASEITWQVNADGEIEVDLLNPPITESFPFRDPPGTQVRAETFVDSIRIIRLANGVLTDQVLLLLTHVTTFPDDGLSDEIVVDVPSPENVYLAFGDEGILQIEPGDVAGDTIATYYYHTDNNAVGLGGNPFTGGEFGADFLSFNPDGTGSTQRRGFGFNWGTNPDGTLTVNFDSGDSNRYIVYSEDGDVAQTILIGSLNDGTTRTEPAEAINFDGVSEFSEDMLLDRRYRGLFVIFGLGQGFDMFDFLFQDGGEGCRILFGPPGQRITWESTPENYMDSFLFRPFAPTIGSQRRSWQAITVQPGLLGDRYWVIENLDINSFIDPAYDFTEPTETPGRINVYEFVEDITGQFDVCGLGTSDSLTTLFASNNGGTGNMFDVITLDGAVQVTEVDVNVEFSMGTQFTIDVYTFPGGWEDSITDDPLCDFNCSFDASAWTLVASGEGMSAGEDEPTLVDIDDFTLGANSTTGIWVTLVRDGSIVDEFRYTNIAGPGNESNADIQILVGGGVTGPFPGAGEGVTLNRAWNGTLYYNTQ